MRLNATSFAHASTATFAVAVVGYAAVRLVSFAAPYASTHLPGHHGAVAQPPPRVHAVRQEPERASRSAHRDAEPTHNPVHPARPATTAGKDDRRRTASAGDAATERPTPAARWRQVDAEPPADKRGPAAWQVGGSSMDSERTEASEAWWRTTLTPADADPGDTAATPTAEPTEEEAEEPDDD
jgi:hypothetical protein